MEQHNFELKQYNLQTWLTVWLENGLLSFKRWKFFIANIVLDMGNLLTRIAIFFIMAEYVGPNAAPFLEQYGGSYASFIVLGILFELVFNAALNTFYFAYASGYWGSHIEMYLLTPVGIWPVLAGNATYQAIWIVMQVFTYIIIGSLIFGLGFAGVSGLTILAVVLAGLLAVTGLGLIAASTFTLLNSKNWSNPVSWLTTFLAGLLAGVYFPIEILPDWLQKLAHILPQTYAFRAGRMAILGKATLADPGIQADIKVLLLMAAILLPLGIYLFKKSLFKAEVLGDVSRWN